MRSSIKKKMRNKESSSGKKAVVDRTFCFGPRNVLVARLRQSRGLSTTSLALSLSNPSTNSIGIDYLIDRLWKKDKGKIDLKFMMKQSCLLCESRLSLLSYFMQHKSRRYILQIQGGSTRSLALLRPSRFVTSLVPGELFQVRCIAEPSYGYLGTTRSFSSLVG